ncbi:hypothetical protein B4U80_03919 [Leptotrombidium deliense]|uniref:Uncharacterized protein n=1 Tax=Leptotrombidium deliense TaxID=299467 RepID=A0A443S6Z6_9ACAR|nr:hypothetical protein B4U80_03919 [Leptotrombidium deliense]
MPTNSVTLNSSDLNANYDKEAQFASTLLISIYLTMFISVLLLFIRIIYVSILRNLNRPVIILPSVVINSSEI